MILTLITIAVALGTAVAAYLLDRNCHENLAIASAVVSLLTTFVLAVMVICIIAEHVGCGAQLAKLQSKREALVYQYENDMYLGDAIGEFNGRIAELKYYHDNPWTSWYVGSYINEVDPIELW